MESPPDRPVDAAGKDSGGAPAQTDPDAAAALVGPRLELQELLIQLVDRAQDVLAAQARLRGLLRANRLISSDLELPTVLHQIAEAACELVHARSGELRLFQAGAEGEQLGHVDTVTTTANSAAGKPAVDHPGGAETLELPVRVRDEVFGVLRLTGVTTAALSAEDRELLASLASTAAVAIDNARLFDRARRRQDWLQASTDITQQLLSPEGEEPLQLIAGQVQRIAEADAVNVVLPTRGGEWLMVEVATGAGADQLTALTYPMVDTVSQLVLTTGRPVLIADMSHEHGRRVHLSDVVAVGPLMVLPLVGVKGVRGALVVGRLQGRPKFTPADVEMATSFANHAAVALELADAREDQERLLLLDDRDRIARDLHDHVIQQLFGVGLTAQSIASGLRGDPRADRVTQLVEDIDQTIRQIRTSIFGLRGPLGPDTGSTRAQLLAVAAATAGVLGFQPRLLFRGPVDAVVPNPVADDLVAVIREGLTNVARHARATTVEVTVIADRDSVTVDVIDNGVGLGDTPRRSGLANLRTRAEDRGGTLTLTSPLPSGAKLETAGGTRLQWTIPLT